MVGCICAVWALCAAFVLDTHSVMSCPPLWAVMGGGPVWCCSSQYVEGVVGLAPLGPVLHCIAPLGLATGWDDFFAGLPLVGVCIWR